MAFGLVPLEKRFKENIKNYQLDMLFDIASLSAYFASVAKLTGMGILLTDRHGEKAVSYGDFAGFVPPVETELGFKVRVAGRTIAHLYTKEPGGEAGVITDLEQEKLFTSIVARLEFEGEAAFSRMELSLYADELEKRLEKEQYQVKHGEKKDPLTGVLNSTYFENRLKVIDRSETVPVGVVCVNINDWKYVNDKHGDETSDRLIQVVAQILKDNGKPEYVIGRCGGDFFNVLIPMCEDDEVSHYAAKIQSDCLMYEDPAFAPSIAVGYVVKSNVEQKLSDLLSDAEYEMFDHKFSVKNAPGYKERLQSK